MLFGSKNEMENSLFNQAITNPNKATGFITHRNSSENLYIKKPLIPSLKIRKDKSKAVKIKLFL
jgi:hypothetical protein